MEKVQKLTVRNNKKIFYFIIIIFLIFISTLDEILKIYPRQFQDRTVPCLPLCLQNTTLVASS